jgi:hypothetical protein
VSGKGGSFARTSFHVGADWWVCCHTYDDATPIFDIDGGPVSVAISIRDRTTDDKAVEFARTLAREAQKFADEIERMHAAQLADNGISTDKAAGSDAA